MPTAGVDEQGNATGQGLSLNDGTSTSGASADGTTTSREIVTTVETGDLSVNVVATRNDATMTADGVGPQEFDDLMSIYDQFLDDRADVIIGDLESVSMASIATPNARAQVDELRAINDAKKAENGVGIIAKLKEWSTVTSIQTDGERRVFTDCTERQREFDWGNQAIYFVTNRVIMVPSADGYQVDSVTVLHDGIIHEAKGDYGCLPPSFTERAEVVAAEAIAEVAVAFGNPQAALDRGVSNTYTDETRAELENILNFLVGEGMHRAPNEQVEIRVAGLHVHKPDFTVVVSVCRTFPEGRQFIDDATGIAGVMDLQPGESEQEWLMVQLDGANEDGDRVSEVIAQGPGCDAPYAGA